MRTIKELLELMLENQQHFEYGLCSWAGRLQYLDVITPLERNHLSKYIDNNRPFMLSSIDAMCQRIKNSDYYWYPGDIKPRIKWIQKHIKINS